MSGGAGDGALADGLARFLRATWGGEVRVANLRTASAGARRRNVLFDATRDGEPLGLVATIVPKRSVQVMAVGVEASLLRLAEAAGVPVPHLHAVCDDASLLGGPFFVAARVDGETIPRRILRLVEATPGLGDRLARQCGAALARLHAVDPARAHPDLARPAGADAAEAALTGAEAQLGQLLEPSPAFALALRWLDRNRPPPGTRQRVLHGDFRNGNLVVGPDGLRAALDWEVAHVGDPMEDLGWLCQRMWRFRNDRREVGGFASRGELEAGYREAGGSFRGESFHWWKTLGTLRWGIGLGLQARAHVDGSFASIVMAASGRRVAELEYDVLMLLRRAYGG